MKTLLRLGLLWGAALLINLPFESRAQTNGRWNNPLPTGWSSGLAYVAEGSNCSGATNRFEFPDNADGENVYIRYTFSQPTSSVSTISFKFLNDYNSASSGSGQSDGIIEFRYTTNGSTWITGLVYDGHNYPDDCSPLFTVSLPINTSGVKWVQVDHDLSDPISLLPTIALPGVLDIDGDGVANVDDLDDDNDGIPDTLEGYNASSPTASRDTDGDGIADYMDLDSDNDGINDVREAGGTDANNDGRADGTVNGNGIPSSAGTNGLTPMDSDGDGKPNAYDLDSDNDGITDLKESGNATLVDANDDGKVDGTVDTDKDGIIGSADGAPATWGDAADPVLADTDGDGVPNMKDLDSDNDGLTDVREAGGTDADGNGRADGTINTTTGIPSSAGNGLALADADGDGISNDKDLDSDNDGISDLKEANNPALADANNDGKVDGTDTDGDGILGAADGAPATWGDAADPVLADTDGDGVPNIKDLDSDNDGINDVREAGGTDVNGDGKADGAVNTATGVPATAGPGGLTPVDSDGDGVTNDKDLDSDNDGITDIRENGGTDANNDGKADGTDADGDGILSGVDGTPTAWGDANDLVLTDTDGDGVPNVKDLDSDNDGISDLKEGNNPALADTNNDGKVDGTDTDGDGILGAADGAPSVWGDANDPALPDSDGDGVPNIKDLDSDNDGINDVKEAGGTDANGDGKADGTVNAATGVPATAGSGGLAPIDSDGDGVTNDKDLDSDNDGITDIRENGGIDADNDGKADGTDADGDGILSGVDGTPNAWGDSNDPAATDSDGDGKPDYKDLDSDNDGKSDLIESGNPTAIAGDVNNDGVIDFNGNDPDGDGALTPGDGTPTFGTNTPVPVDTDGDGLADYKDPVTGTHQDIDDTPYAGADTNNDGVVNGSDTGGAADNDGDGIADVIDADDDHFGGLSSNVNVTIKAFLRGAFFGTRHKDVTTTWMNILKQHALSQPYNTAAFGNYAGTESVPDITFTSTTSDNDIVDWVLLELKKADGTLVDRRAALILENGNVVSPDKVSPVYFKVIPGSYHLTIRHRNHLGLSTELITLSSASNSFDFTTATDATLFGDNNAFMIMNGKTLLVGGNANSNINVRYNGIANDRDVILGYVGGSEIGLINNVYAAQDLNLDGSVRYNGNNNDRDFLLSILSGNEIGFIQQQIK